VETARHIEALRREGELLASAAAATELDAPVPTTPGWNVRDLLRHIGDVHRWARGHVAEERMLPIGKEDLPAIAGPLPPDDHLIEWFRQGHAALVETLSNADPDLQCWSFLPAPSPLAFWARRQAHETGMHRVDGESPSGRITPFAPDVAADGIDELLLGFFGGDGLSRPDGPAASGQSPPALAVHATDVERRWLARLGAGSIALEDQDVPADCTIRGRASDLFLLLWNRRRAEGMDVTGDRSVLEAWRGTAQIHWSRAR
jgi:uncharacterized protein (TIGR03083 family)